MSVAVALLRQRRVRTREGDPGSKPIPARQRAEGLLNREHRLLVSHRDIAHLLHIAHLRPDDEGLAVQGKVAKVELLICSRV